MKDTPKPEGHDKTSKTRKCAHALMLNHEDNTTVPYWDCVYCGAVAFFDPEKPGMLMPRES